MCVIVSVRVCVRAHTRLFIGTFNVQTVSVCVFMLARAGACGCLVSATLVDCLVLYLGVCGCLFTDIFDV